MRGEVVINLPSVSPPRGVDTPVDVRRLLDMTPSPAGGVQSIRDARIDETSTSLRAVLSEAQRVRRRTNSQDPGEQIRRELRQQWARSPLHADAGAIEEIRRVNSKKVEDLRKELEQLHSQVESEEAASHLTDTLQANTNERIIANSSLVADLKNQLSLKNEEMETLRRTYEDSIHSLTIQNSKLSADFGTQKETIQDLTKKLRHASEERDYLLIEMDKSKASSPQRTNNDDIVGDESILMLKTRISELEQQLANSTEPEPSSTLVTTSTGNALLITRSSQTDDLSDHQPEVLLKKLQLAEANLASMEKHHADIPTTDAEQKLKDLLAASERRCEQADAIAQNAEEMVAALEQQISEFQKQPSTSDIVKILCDKLLVAEPLPPTLASVSSLSERLATSEPNHCIQWIRSSIPSSVEKCISILSAVRSGAAKTEIPPDVKMITDLCKGCEDKPTEPITTTAPTDISLGSASSVSVLSAKLSAAEEVIGQLRQKVSETQSGDQLNEKENPTLIEMTSIHTIPRVVDTQVNETNINELHNKIAALEANKDIPTDSSNDSLQQQLRATKAKLASAEELNHKLLTLNSEAGSAVAQADVGLLKARLASNEKLVEQLSSIISSNHPSQSITETQDLIAAEKISALERIITDMSNNASNQGQEIVNKTSDVESKNIAINNLKESVEVAERKCQAALREIEHLEGELQKARVQERELLAKVLSAESRSEQSDAIATDAESRLQDAMTSLQEAEAELQASRKAEEQCLGEAFDDMQRSNAALQSALSFREAELDASQALNEELTAERDKLQALLTAATERADDSIARLSSLESELLDQKKKSDAAKLAESLKQQNSILQSELTDVQEKLKEAQSELTKAQQKQETASANAKKTIRDITERAEAMETLAQKAIREAKNVKEQAAKERASISPEVQSLTAEVHDRLEELTLEKEFLEGENSRIKNEFDTLANTIETLKDQNKHLLESERNKSDTKDRVLNEMVDKMNGMRADHEDLVEELKKVNDDLREAINQRNKFQKEVEELTLRVSGLISGSSEAVHNVTELAIDKAELHELCEELQRQVSVLENQNSQLRSDATNQSDLRVSQLEGQLIDLQNMYDNTEATLQEEMSRNERLESRIQQCLGQLKASEKENKSKRESASQELSAAADTVSELRRRISELTNENMRLAAERKDASHKMEIFGWIIGQRGALVREQYKLHKMIAQIISAESGGEKRKQTLSTQQQSLHILNTYLSEVERQHLGMVSVVFDAKEPSPPSPRQMMRMYEHSPLTQPPKRDHSVTPEIIMTAAPITPVQL